MPALKQIINNFLKPRSNEHKPDAGIIIATAIIIIFGLIMLSSASSVLAYAKKGNSYYFFLHQLFGVALGIIAFWFFSKVDYHKWKKFAFGFLVFSIVLLLLVFIPGLSATYGKARSWINVFGFSLQPSEFVKISFLLYLAAWLESRGKKIADLHQGTGPFLMVLGVIAFLMLLQPDFGTLSIIAATSLIVYFIGGGKKSHIIIILLCGIIAFAIMLYLKPYQMDRIKCMLDPSFSPNDKCYQINQSLIAIGSGGWLGRGVGESRQKFLYIPEVSGDSIFAVIAEEIGFIFSLILLSLFSFLFLKGVAVAKHAPDMFGRILAIGIVSWIFLQAMINIGGMINLIPMTGVPLPFISYGGSAILSAMSAIGILVNISKQTKIGI